jgi:site-specific DNA-methyltransferase (adenine-specific)
MVAWALRSDGWYLRSDIVWHKPNCMPESVKDRPTRAHEFVFLLSKRARYHYDVDAIRERVKDSSRKRWKPGAMWNGERQRDDPEGRENSMIPEQMVHPRGRNKRSVWSIATRGFRGAHFATFPKELVRPCVLAGCPSGGAVLDPFAGTGTVGLVCRETGRDFLGIELNRGYVRMAEDRLNTACAQSESLPEPSFVDTEINTDRRIR